MDWFEENMEDSKEKKQFDSTDVSMDMQEDTPLNVCQKERDEWKDRTLRATADFVNYKKRVEREQALWSMRAQEAILTDLLDTIDDFDRAITEHEKKERTPELDAWLAGFELIRNKFTKLLSKHNVKEITQIKTFNPQLHEALVHLESKEHQQGQIIEVMQKGYRVKDQVLRPAKVSVAK